MRRSNSLFGLVGLILLIFAGAAGAFTGGRTTVDVIFIAVHAGFGILFLIAYLSTGIENLRTFVGQRSTRYGANAVVYSVVFVAVLGIVNYLSTRHYHRFDLTEESVYSLSPQSKKVISGLKKDLVMRAFVEGGANPQLRDLLSSYAYVSKKVSYRMIDPDKDPVEAKKYKITQYNSLQLAYGKENTIVTKPTEEAITNAIIKITRGTKKEVCFVDGHGEPKIDDTQDAKAYGEAKSALENENYGVKPILLATMAKVPDDCSIVAVAGPVRPFQPSEIKALNTYLDGGGRVLALLRPQMEEDLKPFFASWGVKVGDDVVVDEVLRLFQGPALGLAPLTNSYAPHAITRSLRDRSIFPMTRSVSFDGAGKKGLSGVDLVKTGPSSWAETDLKDLFQNQKVSLGPEDTKGPISVAVAVDADTKEMGVGTKEARLVVFGSTEFADNRNLSGAYYNRDFFLNSVGWLAGEKDLLSIRPRTVRASRVQFTQQQGTLIFYLSVLVIPELLLLAGIAVWWRRSNA